jgi:hypothetical protein
VAASHERKQRRGLYRIDRGNPRERTGSDQVRGDHAASARDAVDECADERAEEAGRQVVGEQHDRD